MGKFISKEKKCRNCQWNFSKTRLSKRFKCSLITLIFKTELVRHPQEHKRSIILFFIIQQDKQYKEISRLYCLLECTLQVFIYSNFYIWQVLMTTNDKLTHNSKCHMWCISCVGGSLMFVGHEWSMSKGQPNIYCQAKHCSSILLFCW